MAIAAPLVLFAAEELWMVIVLTSGAFAATLGFAKSKELIEEQFSEFAYDSIVLQCPFAQSNYVTPPKDLPGFPDAEIIRPKTPMPGGKLRKRWRTESGDILEWDYQHGKVEKYGKNGDHKGEYDPESGKQTKPPNPDRKVEK